MGNKYCSGRKNDYNVVNYEFLNKNQEQHPFFLLCKVILFSVREKVGYLSRMFSTPGLTSFLKA